MKLLLNKKNKFGANLANNVTTERQSQFENGFVLHKMISSDLWRIIFIFSIFLNYLVATFAYTFLKHSMSSEVFYFILSLDCLYILNCVASIFFFSWKNEPIQQNWIKLATDFFLAFPYSYIYEATVDESHDSPVFLCLRGILILRLFHIVSYFNERRNVIGACHVKDFIIECFLYLVIYLHGMTCVWYIRAFPNYSKFASAKWINTNYTSSEDLYKICLYLAFIQTTGRNFGGMIPHNAGDRIFSIIMNTSGFILTTGIFIATLSYLLEEASKWRATFRTQFMNIKRYLKYTSLDDKHKKLIYQYYKIFWDKKDGVYESTKLAVLPNLLRNEICLDINIRPLLSSSIFRDKSEAFLRSVTFLMRQEFYQPEELIFFANVVKDKMILVVSGKIEILYDEDNENSIIAFGPGTCLGESALIVSLPSKCSVRAACYTELQVLYRKDFYTIADLYSQQYVIIRETILQRIIDADEHSKSQRETQLTEINSKLQKRSAIKDFKDKLRKNIPLDATVDKYLLLYRLQSDNIPAKKHPKIFLSEKFPWILHPNCILSSYWELLVILTSIYISISYPYYIVFLKKYPSWFETSTLYTDLILVLDVIIILCTGIDEKNIFIQTFTEILHKRLTQFGFYMDFLSCIYLEMFYFIFTKNERFKYVLKLNRLLKAYRIAEKISKIENTIDSKILRIRIIKYIIYLLFCSYLLGACFYLATCFDYICTEDGWYFTSALENLVDDEILISIYYSLSYLCSPTFIDISPKNLFDMMLTCFGILLGLFLIGFCIAELCSTLTWKWRVIRNFQKIIFSTEKILNEKNVGKKILRRVQNFFVLQWNYHRRKMPRKSELFFNASNIIKAEVLMSEKIKIIASLSLFEEKNLDFLGLIASSSKVLILPPNEFVIKKGETVEALYTILEGYCIRYMENDNIILGPKSCFDSVYLFTNENSISTIRTITHVKIFYISHKAFWKVTSQFPLVFKQLQSVEKNLPITSDLWNLSGNEDIITDSEQNLQFEGSFVNLIFYCNESNENYWKPFKKLKYMCFIKFILLPITILPFGIFLKMWMTMRLFSALTVVLLLPNHIILIPHQNILHKFILATDIIAYIDLYVMMHVGFYGSKNQLIIHPLKTAAHYIKGKFMFDLIFCFPWEIFSVYFNEERKSFSSSMVMLVRMGQIYRLFHFFNYFSRDITKKIFNIIEILKYISAVVIFVNLFGALMIKSSCLYFDKDVYNHSMIKTHEQILGSALICEENSWIDKSKFQNFTKFYQVYITSVYFCTSTLTNTAIGDITPQSRTELLLTVIIILSGILFFGYIYAKIASYELLGWNTLRSKYHEMANALRKFMEQEKVQSDLRHQINEIVEYKWKRSKGIQPSLLLQNLHTTLYGDATFALYEKILSKVPIFEDADKSFLRAVSKIVSETYYNKHENIYRADDIISKIFILYDGKMQMNFKNDDYQTVMHPGGIFGNLSPNEKIKAFVTVTALRNSDVLCLEVGDFYHILLKYPSVKEKIDEYFAGGIAFFLPKPAQELDPETNLQNQNEINSIFGCFLLCAPWQIYKVTVSHYSAYHIFYDLLCLTLAYMNSLLVIYEFAFQHHTLPLLCLASITDAIFLMKLVLDMHKSYEDHYGDLITSNRKIIGRYFEDGKKLRRWLYFLCNIPFYYVAFSLLPFSKTNAFILYSCLRMVTLLRLINFFEYYEEKSNQLFTNRLMLKAFSMFIWSTITIHVFTCGWYLCSCPLVVCFEDSWRKALLPENAEKLEIYITCLYFISGLFTTSSNADVVPYSLHEQIYVVAIMMLVNFIIGIFIGYIINIIRCITFAKASYEYSVKELDVYLQNCHTSEFQMEKMRKYTQQLWIAKEKFQLSHLVSLLHTSSRLTLMFDIYGQHLEKVFADAEEAFVRQLAGHLKRTVFFPGNYIVKHEDSDKTMYFIHRGEVEILTIYPNLTVAVHDVLRSGEMLGFSQGLFHGIPHHFSFRSRTIVQTVSLCLDDWEYLLDFFPESKEAIYNKARSIYT